MQIDAGAAATAASTDPDLEPLRKYRTKCANNPAPNGS